MVSVCREKFKNYPNVKIERCDTSREDIPYDNEFDFVSAIRVLKYNENWREIINKISQRLEKGGIFVFTMINNNSIDSFAQYPIKVHKTNLREIKNILSESGLELVEITTFSKFSDIFYNILGKNRISTGLLLSFESILEFIFGKLFLGRIFFIACRKKIKNMRNESNRIYWNNWGNAYSDVWQNEAKQELSRKEMNFISKYIAKQSPKKILDVGVGNGRILENILAHAEETAEVYGIDVSEKMVNICRDKFSTVPAVKCIEVCDISQGNICFDKNFDLITVIRVLKYNKNWMDILERIYEKLNEGGICIFSMPNNHSIAGLKRDTFFY